MDEDTLKGKAKDVTGRVQRQVGEWTGDEDTQAEGAGRQAEGKVQSGIGKVKEAGRDMVDKLKKKGEDIGRDRDKDIDTDEKEDVA